jgi:tetratricopeptide (TPR) repeat protein
MFQRVLTATRMGIPYVVGTASVLICLWCATESVAFGFSQLFGARALENNNLSFANRALSLVHSDPELYRIRAAVLVRQKKYKEAAIDLNRAVELSPRDAEIWTSLGETLEKLQDTTGAITAYAKAARLAPSYARSHWLLGNCLLKARWLEEGFAELRRANALNPTLFATSMELAWQAYKGEPQAIKQALQPQSVHERIALAMFFSNHSLTEQAIPMMREANQLPAEEKLKLLQELLDTNRLAEAYEVWLSGSQKGSTDQLSRTASITDGGFEGNLTIDDPGFGWRFNSQFRTVNASLDQIEPHSGKQSLRLEWHGDPDHSAPIVKQLILAAPRTRYRLKFASRTQSLTTLCPPVITITSRKGDAQILLGQSPTLQQGSSEWQNFSVDFSTTDSPQAVWISITRVAGADGSCPIFGTLWIDDVSLIKV